MPSLPGLVHTGPGRFLQGAALHSYTQKHCPTEADLQDALAHCLAGGDHAALLTALLPHRIVAHDVALHLTRFLDLPTPAGPAVDAPPAAPALPRTAAAPPAIPGSIDCRPWIARLDERCACIHHAVVLSQARHIAALGSMASRCPALREVTLRPPGPFSSSGTGMALAGMAKAVASRLARSGVPVRVVVERYIGGAQGTEALASMPNLTALTATGCFDTTPAQLAALGRARALTALDVTSTVIDVEFVSVVATLPLQTLSLACTLAASAAFRPLTTMRTLQRVDLSGTSVDGDTVTDLLDNPALRHIGLKGCRLGPQAIAAVLQRSCTMDSCTLP